MARRRGRLVQLPGVPVEMRRTLTASIVVGLLIVGGCGGNTSYSAVPTTAEPATTTTTIPPLTQAQVDGAVPVASEYPVGWASSGQPARTLVAREGPGPGTCVGPNPAGLAIARGVVGFGDTGLLDGPVEGSRGAFAIYAFPTPEAAQAFFADITSAAVNCPQTVGWQRPEPEKIGDGSTATYGYSLRLALGSAQVPSADEAAAVINQQSRSRDLGGVAFGTDGKNITVYARFGDVVIATTLFGFLRVFGASNAATIATYEPNVLETMATADAVTPKILAKLGPRPGQKAATTAEPATTSTTAT
jgi:hypothetical protein